MATEIERKSFVKYFPDRTETSKMWHDERKQRPYKCAWCGKDFETNEANLICDTNKSVFCCKECKTKSDNRILNIMFDQEWTSYDYYYNYLDTMHVLKELDKTPYKWEYTICYKIGKGLQETRHYGETIYDRKVLLRFIKKVERLCKEENPRDYEIWVNVKGIKPDGNVDKDIANYVYEKTNDLLYFYTLQMDGAEVEKAGRGVIGGNRDTHFD